MALGGIQPDVAPTPRWLEVRDVNAPQYDFTVSMVGFATDTATTPISFSAIMEGIANGRWQQQVGAVRTAYATGGKGLADAPKKKLPAVMWSGNFTRRAADALLAHSGHICVDLDKLGDRVEGIRDTICADPHTVAAFVSPTGTGIKVVFRCDPTKEHVASFRAAERYVAEHFGLEIDPACKDVSRLCFVSHDPDAFVAGSALELPYPPERKEFVAPAESMPGHRLLAGTTPGDDFDARCDFPAYLASKGWVKSGNYGWTRPGKPSGTSATWNKVPGRFHVFSSECAPLEANATYKPWHVFAFLECGGDFKRAAKELAAKGYGEHRRLTPSPRPTPSGANGAHEIDPETQSAIDAQYEAIHNPSASLQAQAADSAIQIQLEAERKLRERLDARRFNIAKPVPEPVPRFLINGKPISTPGNLTAVIAQAKAGKTAVIAANIAAALVAHFSTQDADTLGITATAPGKLKLLHIDTEQSPYDHDRLIRLALRRAATDQVPDWLDSRYLTGFSAKDLRASLRMLMEDAHAAGGLFAVILDGVADLATNVNDLAESNEIVAELHAAAITYDCPIILVIHDNEGRETNGDGRGHLGKQLMRKAESNLRLKKSEEITVVFSEKMRKAPIFEKDGPRFKWSDQDGMHVSCKSAGEQKDAIKREKLCDMASALFEHLGKSNARYSDIVKGIASMRGVTPSTAEDRFNDLKRLKVISKDTIGFWSFTP